MSTRADIWNELLIPVRQLRRTGGFLVWPESITIAIWDLRDRPAADMIATACRQAGGDAVVAIGFQPDATIELVRTDRLTPEAYDIAVSDRGVRIAGDAAGSLYGAATLTELIERNGLAPLPAATAVDSPDFSRRGLYLDCSRGKVPRVETLEALLPLLARWRINELQLYIENVFTFARHPLIGRGASPFRPEDLLRLQDACDRWQIRFVPSLASFGHMEKILALGPYRHLGEKPGTMGFPGGTTLCPLDPGSIRLVGDLYDEFLPLFRSKDFNACGDEPWELGKGRCADAPGGVAGVYIGFLKQLQGLVQRHGKTMNVWADILLNHPDRLSDVPRDLVLLNWDYEASAARAARSRELAEAGLPFMVCPGTHCWKSHGTRLQTAIENVSRSAAEARRWQALGLMNTNWGDSGHRNPLGVSLHSFAHGGAHGWHGGAVADDSFTDRFCAWMVPQWPAAATTLRLLGTSQERVATEPYFTAVELFDTSRDVYTPVKPVSGAWWPPQYRRQWIAAGDAAAATSVRDELAQLPGAAGPVRFRGFIDDCTLAVRLDRYALGRIIQGQAVRGGQTERAALRSLADEGEVAVHQFARCWRQRNRQSRLADNLTLLNAGIAELRSF